MITETQSDQKTCATCKYWEESDSATGTCHRYAPKSVTFDVSHTHTVDAVFPETRATDWCGEYEPALRESFTKSVRS